MRSRKPPWQFTEWRNKFGANVRKIFPTTYFIEIRWRPPLTAALCNLYYWHFVCLVLTAIHCPSQARPTTMHTQIHCTMYSSSNMKMSFKLQAFTFRFFRPYSWVMTHEWFKSILWSLWLLQLEQNERANKLTPIIVLIIVLDIIRVFRKSWNHHWHLVHRWAFRLARDAFATHSQFTS